jgi:hypothetical protein
MLAESGASLSALKAAGSWRSSTVAERYIDTTDRARTDVAKALSSTTETKDTEDSRSLAASISALLQSLQISYCINVMINIYGQATPVAMASAATAQTVHECSTYSTHLTCLTDENNS